MTWDKVITLLIHADDMSSEAARFPVYRDLAGFDFSSSEVSEALVRQLHRRDFIEPVDNVVLVGGLGTGVRSSHRRITTDGQRVAEATLFPTRDGER